MLRQLRWSVSAERAAEFERWYTEEHLRDVLAAPGIRAGRLFECAPVDFASPSEFNYLTLYEIEAAAAFETPEIRKLAESPSEWTRRVAFDLPMDSTNYAALSPPPGSIATAAGVVAADHQPIGNAVLHALTDCDPDNAEEFQRWYDEEHVPHLLCAPGVFSARRFRAEGAGVVGFPFLALYELADEAVVETEAFLSASAPTAWRERLGDGLRSHVQVYRRRFTEESSEEGRRGRHTNRKRGRLLALSRPLRWSTKNLPGGTSRARNSRRRRFRFR